MVKNIKLLALLLILLLCISSACSNKLRSYLFNYISSYKPSPISEEIFIESMLLLYDKYPEVRITKEILIEYENSNMLNRTGLSDSLNYELIFFAGKNLSNYNIKSSKNNIFYIVGEWAFYEENNFKIYLDCVFLKKHKYEIKFIGDLTCKESKEAEKEFETDILPKIKECIEIVKERKKIENGK